jgi:hypothetical protein
MDNCKNGYTETPKGETGIFFICSIVENKGNNCKYSKWCIKTNQFIVGTDKKGNSCKNFIPSS